MEIKRGIGLDHNKRIFIIHGSNHKIRQKVYKYLVSLDFDPKIAEFERNQGRTIIEKVLDLSKDCIFAIAILTKDDLGGYFNNSLQKNKPKIHGSIKWILDTIPLHGGTILLDESPAGKEEINKLKMAVQILDELKPRTRQNVIFELGLFIGLKGRQSVAILLEDDVEPFSDCQGVVVIRLDGKNKWKKELNRELSHLLRNTGE